MKQAALTLLLLGSLNAFAGGGVIVGNGGGFAEFLLMRMQPEMAERFEHTLRVAGACSSEAKTALANASRDLRAHPINLLFLNPTDYAASLRQAGPFVSAAYPALHARGANVILNQLEAAQWTDEKTALSVLAEGSLVRMGVPEAIRTQTRDCLKSTSLLRYVTADLKSYRQPHVGVLATPQGQILVTDAVSSATVSTALKCGPTPFMDSKSLGFAARGPADVRWNVFLRFTPTCAGVMGGQGLVLSVDLHFLQGSHGDLLNGDPRVRLQYQASSAQVVR